MCADAPWHLGWGRGLQARTRPSLSQEPSRPCSTPGSASKLHLPGLGWDVGRMAHMTRVPAACPSARPDVQAGSRADRAGGPPRRRCRLVPPGAVPGAVPSAVSTRTAWTIAGWKAEAWWKGFAVAQNTSSKQGMIRATQQAVCPSPQGVSGEGVRPAEAPGPPRLCRAPLLWGRGPGVLSEQGSRTHADGGGEAGGPLIHGTCVFPGWVGLRLMQIVSFPCKITLGRL